MMDEGSRLFLRLARYRMSDHYLPKIERALLSVDKTQLWKRERPHLNSIGGLAGHIREHVERSHALLTDPQGVTFAGGIEDYFPDFDLSPLELATELRETIALWACSVDSRVADAAGESPDMHGVFHLVEHTGYHAGQIVDRVRRLAGVSFDFVRAGIHEAALRRMVADSEKGLV